MIEVNLKPDECREYKAWSDYMRDPKESAVLSLEIISNLRYSGGSKSMNATARNRLNHSHKLGYYSTEIAWSDRTQYLSDIHEINNSRTIRQQKEMSASYKEFPKVITGAKTCDHHYGTFVGCFAKFDWIEPKLYAYITTNFCGDIAAASQIMGHGDYLKDGIMLNVWDAFVSLCIKRKVKHIIYSRWSDGWDGLRYWKKSVGMRPEILIEKAQIRS